MNPNTALSPPALVPELQLGNALVLAALLPPPSAPSASPDVESPRVEFRGAIPDFPFDRLMAVSTVERLISRFTLRPPPFILRAPFGSAQGLSPSTLLRTMSLSNGFVERLRVLCGAIPGFQVHRPPSQTRKPFLQSMRLSDRNERRITHLNYLPLFPNSVSSASRPRSQAPAWERTCLGSSASSTSATS